MTMVIATVSIVTVSRQIMTNVLLVLILSDFILGQTMSLKKKATKILPDMHGVTVHIWFCILVKNRKSNYLRIHFSN
jgi:hypothetical protein